MTHPEPVLLQRAHGLRISLLCNHATCKGGCLPKGQMQAGGQVGGGTGPRGDGRVRRKEKNFLAKM